MLPVWKRDRFGNIRTPRPDEHPLSQPIAPGQLLRQQLLARGLKQIEAAELLGYSIRHMSFVLSGRSRISTEFAVRWYRVMGYPHALLLLRAQIEYELHTYLEEQVADSNRSEALQP